jgi:hypothetical protein
LDESSNEGSYNLTTVVLDDLAPTITYTSDYTTVSQETGMAVERVEASLNESYTLGSFFLIEQPSGQVMNATFLNGTAMVNRCKLGSGSWRV